MADNNTNTNTTENTEATVEQAQVEESTKKTEEPATPTEVTFTEAEVAARISKAVNQALEKARKTSDKSAADVAQELSDLRAELAREKNAAFVASEVNSRGIPSSLQDLFLAEDNETSQLKLNAFSKWYKTAIEEAVQAKLNSTETPQFNASQPGVSQANAKLGSMDFLTYYKDKSNLKHF